MTNPMNNAATLNSITGLSLTWEREDGGWVAVCTDRNERSAAAAALRAANVDVSESEGNDDCDDAGTLYLWAAAPTYSYSVQTVASSDPDGDGEVIALDGVEEWTTRESAAAALTEIALRARRPATEYVVAEFRR